MSPFPPPPSRACCRPQPLPAAPWSGPRFPLGSLQLLSPLSRAVPPPLLLLRSRGVGIGVGSPGLGPRVPEHSPQGPGRAPPAVTQHCPSRLSPGGGEILVAHGSSRPLLEPARFLGQSCPPARRGDGAAGSIKRAWQSRVRAAGSRGPFWQDLRSLSYARACIKKFVTALPRSGFVALFFPHRINNQKCLRGDVELSTEMQLTYPLKYFTFRKVGGYLSTCQGLER